MGITKEVLNSNTLDTVSRATNSSKVICRAIENVLKKAGK